MGAIAAHNVNATRDEQRRMLSDFVSTTGSEDVSEQLAALDEARNVGALTAEAYIDAVAALSSPADGGKGGGSPAKENGDLQESRQDDEGGESDAVSAEKGDGGVEKANGEAQNAGLPAGIAAYYTYPPAPNPMLVDFFLREKGINVEAIEVPVDLPGMENRSPRMYSKNSQGGLPFFELENGTTIAETIAMCEFVEELVPLPALIGTTPVERAKTRQWQRRLEEHYVYPAFYGHRAWTASEDSVGEEMHNFYAERFNESTGSTLLPEAWRGLLRWARNRIYWLEAQKGGEQDPDSKGPWICGDRFTVVDIQLWSTLYFFSTFPPEQRILEEADGKLPWIQAWFDRVMERPACVACREHAEAGKA